MPIGSVVPRIRQKVHVYFGDSQVIDSDFLANLHPTSSDVNQVPTSLDLPQSNSSELNHEDSSHTSAWKSITHWCQSQLQLLEEKYHPDYKSPS